jgi:hypothetical protein
MHNSRPCQDADETGESTAALDDQEKSSQNHLKVTIKSLDSGILLQKVAKTRSEDEEDKVESPQHLKEDGTNLVSQEGTESGDADDSEHGTEDDLEYRIEAETEGGEKNEEMDEERECDPKLGNDDRECYPGLQLSTAHARSVTKQPGTAINKYSRA